VGEGLGVRVGRQLPEIYPTVAQVFALCFMANQRFAPHWRKSPTCDLMDFAKALGTISSQIEHCRFL